MSSRDLTQALVLTGQTLCWVSHHPSPAKCHFKNEHWSYFRTVILFCGYVIFLNKAINAIFPVTLEFVNTIALVNRALRQLLYALVLSIFTVLKEKYLCVSKQGPNTQMNGCWWCFGERDVGNINQGHKGVFVVVVRIFCLFVFDFPQELSYFPKIHMLFSLGLRRNWESKSSRWKMLHAIS